MARPSGPVTHSPGRGPRVHSLESAAGTGGLLPAGSREPAAGTGSPLSVLNPRVCPRGDRAGSRGFVPHRECARSTWLPGARRSFPRPATPTAHPRERNARPGPPWYQSGSHTVPPGCAQSPSWRARLRSGAGSPDGSVTATACALPGLDPSPFSALHPSFPANGSGLSRLLSPPLPQRLAGCS